MDNTYPYIASITREAFLFHEMRITAELLCRESDYDKVVDQIINDNLFQYPTEKSVKGMANACIRRLEAMNDETLIRAIAEEPSDVARQICLYAMMQQSRLVYEFMITVIGEKYRMKDLSFGKIDINSFFMRLQEQNDTVAGWSESTINKIRQVFTKILADNSYLDNVRSDHLNPVCIYPLLENAIKSGGDMAVLPAFNCFE